MERTMRAKILVVDDDPGHLAMLRTVLSGWGYAPEGATDGTATPVDAAAPADGAAPAENAAPAADPEVETPGETPAEAEVEKTDNGN